MPHNMQKLSTNQQLLNYTHLFRESRLAFEFGTPTDSLKERCLRWLQVTSIQKYPWVENWVLVIKQETPDSKCVKYSSRRQCLCLGFNFFKTCSTVVATTAVTGSLCDQIQSGFVSARCFVESSWHACFVWQALANMKCGKSFVETAIQLHLYYRTQKHLCVCVLYKALPCLT